MVDGNPNIKIRKKFEVTGSSVASTSLSNGTPGTTYKEDFTNQQTTTSEGHLWPPQTDEEKKRDIGGDFLTERTYTNASPGKLFGEYTQFGVTKTISGQCVYTGDIPSLPAKPSNAQLDAWGTTAIARCDPTQAAVDMSVFIGELLREGLPSLAGVQTWQNRSSKAKSAGGEYLNVQFGWVPLVSEVRSLATAVKDAERILAQYERDAGRLVRRRYDFPSEPTLVHSGGLSHGRPLTSESTFGGQQYVNQTTSTIERKWFSGAFRYWIPKNDLVSKTLGNYVLYADKLLGLELTPETLWNLAPWSWAIDWFTNVGDVLHNISAFNQDHLVMKYGYIMCHQEVKRFRSWPGISIQGGFAGGGTWEAVKYRKIRRTATPYGFGVNLGSLSAYQWSILAALGMTKGPRQL
jgi:hypothetical protein